MEMNFPHHDLDSLNESTELRALDFDVLLAIMLSGKYGYRQMAEGSAEVDRASIADSFVAALERRVALFAGTRAGAENNRQPLGAFLPIYYNDVDSEYGATGNYEDAVYPAALGNIKAGDAKAMFQFNRIVSSEAATADRGIE